MKKVVLCALALLCAMLLLASCGTPGAPGADGKSAYELAVENGYQGTLSEWLASLAGEAGGGNGKSAYELAVKNGYRGTEKEWLKSLVGKDGAAGNAGKSAYELAVESGFDGTLAEWLDSLKGEAGRDGEDGRDGTDGIDGTDGKNGQNGKSAYQLAVAGGYKGTETAWLASLVGADGNDGLSAYELAVENGYRGDIQSWLASLVGESAYDIAVENGYRGTTEAWLASLIGPKGEDGLTPTIGENGNWWIGDTDTGVSTRVDAGTIGDISINANGYWVINGIVLSVKAIGKDGADGVSVSNAYVDDRYILCMVLSNGTTLESGYVGPTYTVSFYDDGGALITAIAGVKHKTGVTAPAAPERDGYRFIGWDKSFDAVTSDLSVTARYERIPVTAHNQLTFSWAEADGKTVVTLSVIGDVRLFGLELTLSVDAVGMSLESVTPQASGLLANIVDGAVRVSYVAAGGGDVTADTDLLTLTFTNTAAVRAAELTPTGVDIFDDTLATETYTVAGNSYER